MHMIMLLRVGMKVLMENFAVTVHVPVDKVGRHQQVLVAHDASAVRIHFYRMVFPDHNGTGADLFDNVEVMRGRNNGLTTPGEILDKLNQPDLASWVETTCGFVKKQDIGIRRKYRCNTDLLFFAAAQHVGRPGHGGFRSPASR